VPKKSVLCQHYFLYVNKISKSYKFNVQQIRVDADDISNGNIQIYINLTKTRTSVIRYLGNSIDEKLKKGLS